MSFFMVMILVFIVIFSKTPGRRESADKSFVKEFKYAIEEYIALSNDIELKFNRSNTVSVDELLVRFQKTIIIGEDNIEPLLPPRNSPIDAKSYYPVFNTEKYRGWEISVNKKSKKVKVNPGERNEINIK